ncbi:MAG TPA: hypothetical protein PKY77_19625 [Phycisphaerae bacterium]|nr:hypothetical protein [Phycisphaerae bacterium]HRY71470.1 hypothetical protein [Phycisphaerae bacterium]HSA30015.1 hypothetical protein [Phycisphaerae bacterium]
MIRTQTVTQVTVRLKVVVLNICYVVQRTVKDARLEEIIAYCVPEKLLKQTTIWGGHGKQADARLDTEVDYNLADGSPRLRTMFSGGGSFNGPERWPGDPPFAAASEGDICKIWKEAVEWFVDICQQNGLDLFWTVSFLDKDEEMCRKFNLVHVRIDDRTVDAPAHTIPNSVDPCASLVVRFAKTICS